MSNFKEATGRTIQQAFNDFHQNNPQVFEIFSDQVFRALNKGKKKISSKAIINWIRWEKFIETHDEVKIEIFGEPQQFKINDAYSSRYARLFIDKHPDLTDVFELREIRSF